MTQFQELVWEATKKIPKGKVSTYGDIAAYLDSKAHRAVGSALNKNPYAPVVPCHRVVAGDGSIGGFAFGVEKKVEILEKEGIKVENNRVFNFEKKRFTF